MKLFDYISVDRIKFLEAGSKKEALEEMAELISSSPVIEDEQDFLEKIFEREKILSTGIGLGIAVPHVKINSVKDFVVAIGVSKKGIPFDAIDGSPVNIIVMIGASERQKDDYVKVLAQVVLILKNDRTRANILKANSPQEIYDIFVGH